MRKLASIALSLLLSAGTALADSPKKAPKDAASAAEPAPPKRGMLNGSKTSAEAQPNQAQSQQQVTDSVPSRR